MLVINPEECIDCGVCEPECPIDAIQPDTKDNMAMWVELNQKYANLWPKITTQKPAPADAAEWEEVQNKLVEYFSEKGGG